MAKQPDDERHEYALWLECDHAVPTSLNLRREVHGDERVCGIDISLTAALPHTVLDQLEAGSAAYWRAVLWDDDGNVREIGLAGAIAFARKASGVHVVLSVPSVTQTRDELTLYSATVRKFRATPIAGAQIELAFQVQSDLDDPDRQVPWLNRRYLAESVNVRFQGHTQRDIEDEDAPEQAELPESGADGEGHQAFPAALDGTSKSALGGWAEGEGDGAVSVLLAYAAPPTVRQEHEPSRPVREGVERRVGHASLPSRPLADGAGMDVEQGGGGTARQRPATEEVADLLASGRCVGHSDHELPVRVGVGLVGVGRRPILEVARLLPLAADVVVDRPRADHRLTVHQEDGVVAVVRAVLQGAGHRSVSGLGVGRDGALHAREYGPIGPLRQGRCA